MTTWISHLRIAEGLLDNIGGLEPEAFYYGSLAPDSGIPNDTWTEFDPPKTKTHFIKKGQDEGSIRDLRFYERYIASCASTLTAFEYSFRFGYFFHLVCDNLWALRVWQRTKADWAMQLAEDENFAWEIKKDWYGLDHKYLRDHHESVFWETFLATANPPSALYFLPKRALHHQLNYIKDFYSNHRPDDLDRPYPYLNEAAMDLFVEQTTKALTTIYDVLVTRPNLTAFPSALAWLPPAEHAVYPLPLGDELIREGM